VHLVKCTQTKKKNTHDVSSTHVAICDIGRVKHLLFFYFWMNLWPSFSHLSLNVLLLMQITEF